jgi:chromosome segregation ATPase
VVQTQIDEVEQQQVAAAQQVRSQAEGERVDDPEELLARLQQRLVAVRAEREALVTEGNALQQEIARLREEMPRLLASAEREVEGMLGRDSRGETWVAAAREQLEGRIRGLEERATQLRARMDALRGEVRGLQRDIGSLQRQVAMAGALRRASGRQPDARDHYEDAMRDLAVVAGGGNAEGRTSMLGGYVC